jgi:hypothetical protein
MLTTWWVVVDETAEFVKSSAVFRAFRRLVFLRLLRDFKWLNYREEGGGGIWQCREREIHGSHKERLQTRVC